MKRSKLVKRFRIDAPQKFRLADHDPAENFGMDSGKEELEAMLADDIGRLAELQQRLYAENRWALLAIFQAMDAGGKDGTIKHVMTGVNPQGCEVHSFKAPSMEELEHDFLWRIARKLPPRGKIGIFNRSHYEEVLVVRVHHELLENTGLPPPLITRDIWKQRFKDIRGFERHLANNGTVILKFHLRISKEEQKRRFLARLNEPGKRWKFSANDLAERERWDDYMEAYEDMIRHTSTPEAPWFVVPADHKPFAHLVVAAALVEALERLELAYPKVGKADLEHMQQIRQALEKE